MKQRIVQAFFLWLPLAVVLSCVCGLVYLTVQQSLRAGANDPQIQVAEDAAQALGSGQIQPSYFASGGQIDVSKSLAPFLAVYDRQGRALASTGELDGKNPTLPPGVFQAAQAQGEDRLSWQPRAGVRQAIVVLPVQGRFQGFVVAGRSLREVESRENFLAQAVTTVWLVALVATFLACMAGAYFSKVEF